MIRASGTTAVIGQRLERATVADVPVQLIDIEAALAYGKEPSQAARAAAPQHADAIACTVFISGRDDASRVVSISHRNLTNLIYAVAKRPGVGERDVVVASSPLTTSRAAFELFLPLLTGARLVVALDRELAGGRALLHLLQRTGATILYGAPHTWSA
jgi:non-ribosomal peptide synthetase component F